MSKPNINPTIHTALQYGLSQAALHNQIQNGAARDLYPQPVADLALEQLGELNQRIVKELNQRIEKP